MLPAAAAAAPQHPIHYSNVMLLDPEKNTPVRVSIQYEDQHPYRRVRAYPMNRRAIDCHAAA
jgi:ribosomal protein L24